MEKVTGTLEVVHSDTEKTQLRYERDELSKPERYNGHIPFAIGNDGSQIMFNFDYNRTTGKINLNMNNFDDLTILAEVKLRIEAIKTAITEHELDLQTKIDSLQAYYETQTPQA